MLEQVSNTRSPKMKSVTNFVDLYPIRSGFVGVASGFGSWVLSNSANIQTIAGTIGSVFGALTAIVTFFLLMRKLWRDSAKE
jgi:hypothetical protein